VSCSPLSSKTLVRKYLDFTCIRQDISRKIWDYENPCKVSTPYDNPEARIAQWYSAGLRAGWSGVLVLAGDGNFSHHRVQTGSGVHPASYPMATKGFSLGVKRPEREADHSYPTSAKVKDCMDIYLHSPNTPSWRGDQLKHMTTLPFVSSSSSPPLGPLACSELILKICVYYMLCRIPRMGDEPMYLF
jgi:hypothetical protein